MRKTYEIEIGSLVVQLVKGKNDKIHLEFFKAGKVFTLSFQDYEQLDRFATMLYEMVGWFYVQEKYREFKQRRQL